MFDIVVAKTFRPEDEEKTGFYLRDLFDDFRRELDSIRSGYNTIDDMTLLQILAVIVRDNVPEARVQNITDRYLNMLQTEHLEQVWAEGKKAIRKVFDFLENHLRLRGPVLIPYRYFLYVFGVVLLRE